MFARPPTLFVVLLRPRVEFKNVTYYHAFSKQTNKLAAPTFQMHGQLMGKFITVGPDIARAPGVAI